MPRQNPDPRPDPARLASVGDLLARGIRRLDEARLMNGSDRVMSN